LHTQRLVTGLVIAASSVALSGAANATGIAVARFGGEQGHPMADNPTAIYYNPAGLALGHGTRILLEGTFALRMLDYTRPEGAIDNPNEAPGTPDLSVNSGEATLSNLIISPFIGVASDLGVPNLGLGLGFYTPLGGQATWDKIDAFEDSSYPGAVDGPQRWHNIEGAIRSSYVTAAGAYKFPFGLSVGVGANLAISLINTVRAANPDGTDDVVAAGNRPQEGRSWLDVSGMTFSLGVGLAYQPRPDMVFGVSYQSQPGFGDMTLEGTLNTKFGTSPASSSDVEVVQQYPDIIRLGGKFRPAGNVELRLWGSFERWSVFKSQCILNVSAPNRRCELNEDGTPVAGDTGITNNIPRDWKNAFGVRASGSYWLNPGVELQLGVGYDGNAVPDKTMEASLPDWNDITATVGTVVDLLGGNLQVNASVLGVFSLSRTIDPRPRMDGESVAPYRPPTRIPDGAGEYSAMVLVLQLGVGYRF
jgi:long-chain fatty acid transport protein